MAYIEGIRNWAYPKLEYICNPDEIADNYKTGVKVWDVFIGMGILLSGMTGCLIGTTLYPCLFMVEYGIEYPIKYGIEYPIRLVYYSGEYVVKGIYNGILYIGNALFSDEDAVERQKIITQQIIDKEKMDLSEMKDASFLDESQLVQLDVIEINQDVDYLVDI